jgi:hypothetical protein
MRAILMVMLLLIMTVPLASASTLDVRVLPGFRQTELTVVSSVNLTMNYPSDSFMSMAMGRVNFTLNVSTPNVPQDSPGFLVFEGALKAHDPNVTLENMSVDLVARGYGTSTSFMFSKNVTITAWVSGIFNRSDGELSGNFNWKAFVVRGDMPVGFNGQTLDVNSLGSMIGMMHISTIGGQGTMPSYYSNESTINFSAFGVPMSDWSKVYYASTNTTVFTHRADEHTLLTLNETVNGESYSLKVTTDPSSAITVPGYAEARGDYIVVVNTAPSFPLFYVVIAVIGLLLAAVAGTVFLKKRG